ncbi:hypothetical protein Tco_0230445 [Tanacetum coccineum]
MRLHASSLSPPPRRCHATVHHLHHLVTTLSTPLPRPIPPSSLDRIFKKKAKNKQSRARNGKGKVKSMSKVNQVKKIQLKGPKLPSLKMWYKKTRAEIGN